MTVSSLDVLLRAVALRCKIIGSEVSNESSVELKACFLRDMAVDLVRFSEGLVETTLQNSKILSCIGTVSNRDRESDALFFLLERVLFQRPFLAQNYKCSRMMEVSFLFGGIF